MGPWGEKEPVLGRGGRRYSCRDGGRWRGEKIFVCVVVWFDLIWVGRKDRVRDSNYKETLGNQQMMRALRMLFECGTWFFWRVLSEPNRNMALGGAGLNLFSFQQW